ncbi:MAG: ABC transporter ATP-binding protein [Candidatus Bipolaricaulota bacterium]|nr:ABC transporter ATP-binding protein [Candidatus Bipolaricaulota bacterium]MCS7274661.1 ABC transporter ATP-binding protein [Candidatus Bipolaricaulota bacterium]MDW8111488.1 ABC transporter ATP-binding protein [Candidatus Bipolaricaulota bacterium]MDW8329622.1 ABC transporter ATP-binding protein [Candidatus Bipolaricaulota bacterium]
MEALRVERLRKSFGGLMAVKDLSFSVEQGEILGLIGPNGAGKSTVFNLIMGTFRPDRGRIFFKNREITGWPTYKIVNEGVARVFQIARYFPHKTVYENVEISAIPNEIFRRADQTELKTMTVCRRTGLCGDEGCGEGSCLCRVQWPGMLPQGGLRRLEIARAIGTDPELLLLDEPFAGLSPHEVDEMAHLISDLRREGQTIVLVDHNMRGVMGLVDRVVVLCFGEKLAEGTPEEIMRDPKVQEAYLAGGGV